MLINLSVPSHAGDCTGFALHILKRMFLSMNREVDKVRYDLVQVSYCDVKLDNYPGHRMSKQILQL